MLEQLGRWYFFIETKKTGGRVRLRGKGDDFCFGHVQFEVSVGFPEYTNRHRTGALKSSLARGVDLGVLRLK